MGCEKKAFGIAKISNSKMSFLVYRLVHAPVIRTLHGPRESWVRLPGEERIRSGKSFSFVHFPSHPLTLQRVPPMHRRDGLNFVDK